MSNRRSQLRVAYASGFPSFGFGVAPTAGALTKLFITREGGQSHIEPIYKQEPLRDCTSQFLRDYIVLHRAARLTLDIEVTKEVLAGLIYLMFGQGSVSDASMLGPTAVILPSTGLRVGFADGDDPGMLFYDAVGETLKVTGKVENKLQVRATLVGRGDVPDADTTDWPECENVDVLRLDSNTSVMVNGVERVLDTRSIDFSYNNNLPLNDLPYALGVLDISRPLERGDDRPAFLDWVVTGRENDALGRASTSVPPTHYPWALSLGDPALLISAEDAILRPNGTNFQTWDGEVGLACLNIQMTPTRVPGDAQTPMHMTA